MEWYSRTARQSAAAGYRDRYFGAALASLARADVPSGRRRQLARLLYPATLCDEATVAAGAAVAGSYGDDCGVVVAQQTAIMRSVLAARSAFA
ncbi:MAG TPA: hypothetical protein VFB06_31275 [Streptosporangiaceae bacterium]|nr:hypothetical protein [Streptosporangiaceae bacterium]